MEIITIRQGVNNLLNKTNIDIPDDWTLQNGRFSPVLQLSDGTIVPVLWWRYSIKLSAIKDITSKWQNILCSVKTFSFDSLDNDLDSLLYKEIDLAQWWLNSQTEVITAFEQEKLSGNYILRMRDGTIANLELSCTLPKGANPQDRHIVYSKMGLATDKPVDTMINQDKIYLYNDAGTKSYYDTELWLYGLSADDAAKCYCIYSLLIEKQNKEEYIQSDKNLLKILSKIGKNEVTRL